MSDNSNLLDVQAIANRLVVKPETVRWYHKKGQMPKADMYFGRTPVWKSETIDEWVSRRGQRPQASHASG